ncbi:MAG TPA: lipopolysaccharide biosynthesis protein [Candidatus Lokiarchaeia archaeon]|nr:lipopolysaccharide biosynthesis protein [Candidatus Lokiarchaeia archaeon]
MSYARHVKTALFFGICFIIGLPMTSMLIGIQSHPARQLFHNIGTRLPSSSLTIRVGLIDNFTDFKLAESLRIDPSFNIMDLTAQKFLQELGNGSLAIDVLVLANLSYSSSFITGIKTYLDNNDGRVFLALGSDNVTQGNLLNSLDLLKNSSLGTAVVGVPKKAPVPEAIWSTVNETNPLVTDIDWKAVPNVQVYSNSTAWNVSAINVLQATSQTAEPLLFEARQYTGRLIVITPWISSDNLDFELCLYFNYFNYHVVEYLAHQTALSYLDWPYSPVPHAAQDIWIYTWFVVIIVVGVGGFVIVRRYSKHAGGRAATLRHVLEFGRGAKEAEAGSEAQALVNPESETRVSENLESNTQLLEKPESGASPEQEYVQATEGGSSEEANEDVIKSEWDRIGIHRQIAQFFWNMILNFFIAIPIMLLALWIYPNFVQPYPMVTGWQSITGAFFSWIGTIADMGMTVAAGKYFAQYRVHDPQKAVHYLQMLVWWNIMTSLIKTSIIVVAGIFLFRSGNLAYLGWICILIALQQFPNCQGILGTTLDAMQRWDYKVLCDTVGGNLLNTFINYGMILLCRFIFAGIPVYGAAFGTVVGLYIGGIVTSWTSFLYYFLAFKKLGFHVGTLFRANFTGAEMKEAFNYGYKIAVGNVIVPLVGVLETYMIATFVLNSSAELGFWSIMSSVTGFIGIDLGFFNNLRPAISEAHGNGKMQLVKYYITEGLHYINFFMLVLFTVILAIGAPLLVGFAGSFWAPAGQYVVPLALSQVVTVYSAIGDNILQATGNTKTNMIVWFIEQVTRAVLLVIIMPIFHPLWAILLASVPAALVKEAVMFTIIKKKIVNFDWALVHNFIAPGVSAFILYFYAVFLVNFFGFLPSLIPFFATTTGEIVSSILIFLAAVFGGLFLYLFLMGLFGGWDDNTLGQFQRGLAVVRFVSAFFVSFYKVTALGHRLCPWKNRFGVKVFDDATAEAKQLTSEKKRLVM